MIVTVSMSNQKWIVIHQFPIIIGH